MCKLLCRTAFFLEVIVGLSLDIGSTDVELSNLALFGLIEAYHSFRGAGPPPQNRMSQKAKNCFRRDITRRKEVAFNFLDKCTLYTQNEVVYTKYDTCYYIQICIHTDVV